MGFIMKSGKNLNDLLNENKAQILRYLIHHRGCSRTELSEAVGLKPASITKIVQQLLEDNLVVETGLSEGLRGGGLSASPLTTLIFMSLPSKSPGSG